MRLVEIEAHIGGRMSLEDLAQKLSNYTCKQYITLTEGLGLSCRQEPFGINATVYEPLVCLILQGEKENIIGNRKVVVSVGQSLIVSHHLPVVARVTSATPQRPYISLIAQIDLAMLRSLDEEIGDSLQAPTSASAFEVTAVDDAMVEVFARYVRLAENPVDARVLTPLIRKELHYRLLQAENSGMLRSLLHRNSHASNISRAIETLRSDFRQRLKMSDLALSVGMSPSSFYKHFKAVTDTTPLQYQKDLRLTEARRLLLGDDHTVSTAAFAVGYESASQFSREYTRKFGATPRGDRLHT